MFISEEEGRMNSHPKELDALDIVSELTYRSYAHNRRITPAVSAERWELVFGPNAKQMEQRFQDERKQKLYGGLNRERT